MKVRKLLKRVLPDGVVTRVSDYRKFSEFRAAEALKRNWESVRDHIARVEGPTSPPRRVTIVPSDQGTLFGSRGEDAMITATVGEIRRANPDAEITVMVASEEAEALAKSRGLIPAWVWNEKKFIEAVRRSFESSQPDLVFVVGADVIDGHYGEIWGLKLLLAADIAARMGIRATILGFSFNSAPKPIILETLSALHRDVNIYLRGVISLERLQRLTSSQGALVADCAFLLKPDPPAKPLEDWVAERRRNGRRIIGFNLHPMLFPRNSRGRNRALVIGKAIEAIRDVSMKRDVAWLLLPHDFREDIGDEAFLSAIFDGLCAQLGEDIRLYEQRGAASALKGVAGLVDGIVTARMHLAIAGLGQGVPVACITYQDKFEGLFRHFELDGKLLLTPTSALKGESLRDMLLQFVDEIPDLKSQVAHHLPAVLELAKKNYESLHGEGPPSAK
jgi:polysaccharide pyruvyl transferase WcaK-like protein